MGRGLDYPQSQRKGGDFIPNVRLKEDREFCRVRFLTEHDEIYWATFHRILERKQFKGWELCVADAYDDECERCGDGDRPGLQFFAWVYVYEHYYVDKPTSVPSTKVKVGNATFYQVEVNSPLLMRYSISHIDAIKMRSERLGTLLDRDYEWIRVGEAGSLRPSYMLEPMDKEAMLPEIKKVAKELPDLEDVAIGVVISLQLDEPAGETPPAKKTRARKAKEIVEELPEEPEEDDSEVPW